MNQAYTIFIHPNRVVFWPMFTERDTRQGANEDRHALTHRMPQHCSPSPIHKLLPCWTVSRSEPRTYKGTILVQTDERYVRMQQLPWLEVHDVCVNSSILDEGASVQHNKPPTCSRPFHFNWTPLDELEISTKFWVHKITGSNPITLSQKS